MAEIDIDALTRIADVVTEGKGLTPAERAELLRIAQGFACKDSAASANISPETIRARRKRIYHKLGVAGAGEVLSHFLAVSLHRLAASAGRKQATAPQPTSEAADTVH